jgi:hypothetical protein
MFLFYQRSRRRVSGRHCPLHNKYFIFKPEVFSYVDGEEVTGGGLRRVHLRIATRPAVCKYADEAGADDSNCAEVVVPIRLGKSTRDHAARIATLRTGPS